METVQSERPFPLEVSVTNEELDQEILLCVRRLKPQAKEKVLRYVRRHLRQQNEAALKELRDLFAASGCDLSAEVIDEARREAWGNFGNRDVM